MKNKKIIYILIIILTVFCFWFIQSNGLRNSSGLLSSNNINIHDNKLNENVNQSDIDNTNKNNQKDNSQNKEQQNKDETVNTSPNITLKEDAYYEEWLAAAMCMSLTLTEDSFDVQHIYYSTETPLNNKMDSKGVYLVYENGEETICIYSSPLKEENKENGTRNLYTQDLGFNSYQKINLNKMNFEKFKETDLDSLSTLISQSMLVSLYEN